MPRYHDHFHPNVPQVLHEPPAHVLRHWSQRCRHAQNLPLPWIWAEHHLHIPWSNIWCYFSSKRRTKVKSLQVIEKVTSNKPTTLTIYESPHVEATNEQMRINWRACSTAFFLHYCSFCSFLRHRRRAWSKPPNQALIWKTCFFFSSLACKKILRVW